MQLPAFKFNTYRKQTVIFLAFCGLALIAFYIYCISASIVHVVIRKETYQDIAVLHSQISELESRYIQAQHRVSSEIASLDGYVVAEEKIFVDRTPTSLVLNEVPLATNER